MKKDNTSRTQLQIRMTTIISSVVILISSVVMLIVAFRIRNDYEELINDRFSDDLTAITRIMEQKLLRVESTTRILAEVVSQFNEVGQADFDSLFINYLESVEDVWGVYAIFDNEKVPCADGYYERGAYVDSSGLLLETYINGKELDSDADWVNCYIKGESFWGSLSTEYTDGQRAICYFVPLDDSEGGRFGMAYSIVLEQDLTSFVKGYKLRQDADISIYKPDGTMVVAPDAYILELSPEDMIVQEDVIDNIGWDVVISADRKIIRRKVRQALISMALILVLMFVIIYLAIKYAVRYVAGPFVREQQRVEKEKAVLENEMSLAERAQKELVPHIFPPFPERKGIDIAACLHPARKVGGDLYDYFTREDKLFFCIGDVSGKGVQASLFMTATHYLFRSMAAEMPLADAARQMNVSLCTDNAQCRFVTLWLGCLDLRNGELEYINAGHDAPILLRDGRAEFFPDSENISLGIYEEEEFVTVSTALNPGDYLLLYTDGVTEAMDAQGHEFGKDRLLGLADKSSCENAAALVDDVLACLQRHSSGSGQSDDITMLCLRYIKNDNN